MTSIAHPRNLSRRPSLPDGLVAAAELAPLLAEYDDLRQQAIGLQRATEGLVRERREAGEADRAAGALALRGGKGDPGDKASRAVEERAATLKRRTGHVITAQQAVVRDIEHLLAANGRAWAADATAQARQARLDVDAALDAYRAGWERLVALETSARWLRSLGMSKPAPILPDVPGLEAPNRSPYSLATVLTALTTIGTEPVAAPADEEADEAEEVA